MFPVCNFDQDCQNKQFSLKVRYKEIRNNNKYSNYSIFDEKKGLSILKTLSLGKKATVYKDIMKTKKERLSHNKEDLNAKGSRRINPKPYAVELIGFKLYIHIYLVLQGKNNMLFTKA